MHNKALPMVQPSNGRNNRNVVSVMECIDQISLDGCSYDACFNLVVIVVLKIYLPGS
jgi:hypothetical protein